VPRAATRGARTCHRRHRIDGGGQPHANVIARPSQVGELADRGKVAAVSCRTRAALPPVQGSGRRSPSRLLATSQARWSCQTSGRCSLRLVGHGLRWRIMERVLDNARVGPWRGARAPNRTHC
jgi:hypothetical protein